MTRIVRNERGIALAIAIPTAGLATPAMVIGGLVVVLALGRWSTRRLGGATGDVFGAAVELVETLAIVAAVAAVAAD